MTEQEFAKVMSLLEKYYKNFYAGANKQDVFGAWYPLFRDDEALAVERAVVEVVCTLRFPPTVADIKLQLAEDRLEDQPTGLEAFQTISQATRKAYDRMSASEAFNDLPPMMRKLVGNPSQLISWHNISSDSFETVVMSAIRSGYEVLAKREAKYYAMPAGVRKSAKWRIEGAGTVALPEPEKQVSIDQMMDRWDQNARDYRAENGMVENPDYSDRVAAFITPMTDAEKKMLEAKRKHQEKVRLENMKP